jgi:hypothetical protein
MDEIYKYSKYIIFLPNRFNVAEQVNIGCLCAKIRRNILRDLNDKGITVRFRSNIRDYTTNKEVTYKFNNDFFPKMNVLYVHLIGGEYYTDDIYTKKKTEKERGILFLLAAILGVKTIQYKITKVTHTMKKMSVKAKIKQSTTEFKYSKSLKEIKGEKGQESYINRGAPMYSLSETIEQVEDNIKSRFSSFDSNTFSCDFYEKNSKLKTFVYKRFNFKMCNVEYTSDFEFDLDISFGVRETLLDYGIGVDYNEHNITCERITYNLDFYEDKELRLKLSEIFNFERDPFSVVREVYDDDDNKDTAIYHITEYVRKYAKSCSLSYFKKREPKNILKDNYHERLNHWMKENTVAIFEKECHKFTSSFQIRTWFKEALIYGDEEVEELEDEYEGAGNYGILKLKRDINKESKNVLLKTENYTFASNQCGNTALEYPSQYSCSMNHRDKERDRDVNSNSLIQNIRNSPINRNITRSPSPISSIHSNPMQNKIIRRRQRRTTSESEDSVDRKCSK